MVSISPALSKAVKRHASYSTAPERQALLLMADMDVEVIAASTMMVTKACEKAPYTLQAQTAWTQMGPGAFRYVMEDRQAATTIAHSILGRISRDGGYTTLLAQCIFILMGSESTQVCAPCAVEDAQISAMVEVFEVCKFVLWKESVESNPSSWYTDGQLCCGYSCADCPRSRSEVRSRDRPCCFTS